MSRHLDNLNRLFQKLKVRYGEDDAIVLQVKQDLESRLAIESMYLAQPITYRARVSLKATTARHRAPVFGNPV